ncbi:MAG: alpha/beta fold hydrolase [Planctomycetota bacterium]
MIRIASVPLLLALLVPPGAPAGDSTPRPPGPPASGPGSAEYAHAAVRKTRLGEGVEECWVFEPAEPRPATAPVVVFLHGFGATSPRGYGAWIDHLARRGQVVLFPRYQTLFTPLEEFTANAAAGVRGALEALAGEGRVHLRRRELALVGHSMGGVLAANLAALAPDLGLPAPRAVFAVEPGITSDARHPRFAPLADLARIPADTLLVALYGDADGVTGARDAERIYRESTAVSAANKDLLVLRSDAHGRPRLVADHLAAAAVDSRYGRAMPYTTNEARISRWGVDALDWWGLWRPFDALCAAAFRGERRDLALGASPERRAMGIWSDGQPVRELEVVEIE